MEKLNKTFKINPLYEADGYKVGHPLMIAPNTTKEYWTWIPRSTKYMPEDTNKIMSAGQQLVVRYLHSTFQENFFEQPIGTALKFTEDISKYLMQDYNFEGFKELHKLGYLPIKIKSLKEGIFTNPNIPHMTGVNTLDGYAWLGLFLETYISKLAWQLPTAATIAHKFKSNAIEWIKKTDEDNLWLTNYMCHDFHSRGGNPFTSIAVGLGHAMSNYGSDTLNVIPASRYYYDFTEDEVPIYSVNASEHSVSCTKIFTVGEQQMISDWLKIFPKGILSIVADTFDLWKLITEYLPANKEAIMARDGKLVIRPDSGDPVDIICGINYSTISDANDFDGDYEDVVLYKDEFYRATEYSEQEDRWYFEKLTNQPNKFALKGVIELLWDIFGGTVNEQGYKVLDPHIGAIYGDSINLERQVEIYKRLEAKGFAATNVVLGVGSYTYVMLTRDSAGYAAKGAWFECEGIGYDIHKDPVTDDGTKKSLKGLQAVFQDDNLEYYCVGECDSITENKGCLQVIYEDGKFFNQTNLTEIRERLKNDKTLH